MFKYDYIQNTTVASDKEVNILMYRIPSSYLIICRSCKIKKWSSFWLTLYSWKLLMIRAALQIICIYCLF